MEHPGSSKTFPAQAPRYSRFHACVDSTNADTPIFNRSLPSAPRFARNHRQKSIQRMVNHSHQRNSIGPNQSFTSKSRRHADSAIDQPFSSGGQIINPHFRWFNHAPHVYVSACICVYIRGCVSRSTFVEAGDTGRDDEGHLEDRGTVQRGEWRQPDLRGTRWQAAPKADVVPREHRDRRVLSLQCRVWPDS